MRALAVRRLARLAHEGSPRLVARALQREMWLRRERAALERALRSSAPVVVGPFLGEVGFELLYWRPFVRRLLRRFRVDPERVTAVSRGGAALWYRDVAGRGRDVLEALSPAELRYGVDERIARTGQRKQLAVDGFDRLVVERLGLASAALLHPLYVYWGSRFVWEGLEGPDAAGRYGDYDPLEREPSLADGLPLPERFVAVKAYANECVPAGERTQEALGRLLERLASQGPVVLLETGLGIDEHEELAARFPGTVSLAGLLDGETNLVRQAEVVARADVLVATYGGFSYLGPFLDVPTVAIACVPEWNPHHERVLRAVRPAARFVRCRVEEAADAVSRLRA